jgi:hypothetical protein
VGMMFLHLFKLAIKSLVLWWRFSNNKALFHPKVSEEVMLSTHYLLVSYKQVPNNWWNHLVYLVTQWSNLIPKCWFGLILRQGSFWHLKLRFFF